MDGNRCGCARPAHYRRCMQTVEIVRIGPGEWREFRDVRLASLSDTPLEPSVPGTPTGSTPPRNAGGSG